jgi:hypothetical protein
MSIYDGSTLLFIILIARSQAAVGLHGICNRRLLFLAMISTRLVILNWLGGCLCRFYRNLVLAMVFLALLKNIYITNEKSLFIILFEKVQDQIPHISMIQFGLINTENKYDNNLKIG